MTEISTLWCGARCSRSRDAMKLATLKNGSRDGTLAVVTKDLARAARVADIAPTLLDAIERWPDVEPLLRERAAGLERGSLAEDFAFEPSRAMSPLPRCYQWLDGSAFANHGSLMERAFDLGIINEYERYPLVYQGASDDFLGPCDDVCLPSESDNMDFEGEVAVVVDEVPMGTTREQAAGHVKLLMLVNDVSLRALAPPGNDNRLRLDPGQTVHRVLARCGDAG